MSKEEKNKTPKYIKVLEDEIDKLGQKINLVAQESKERDLELMEHIKKNREQLENFRKIIKILSNK
jgi:hypothetical protein